MIILLVTQQQRHHDLLVCLDLIELALELCVLLNFRKKHDRHVTDLKQLLGWTLILKLTITYLIFKFSVFLVQLINAGAHLIELRLLLEPAFLG